MRLEFYPCRRGWGLVNFAQGVMKHPWDVEWLIMSRRVMLCLHYSQELVNKVVVVQQDEWPPRYYIHLR